MELKIPLFMISNVLFLISGVLVAWKSQPSQRSQQGNHSGCQKVRAIPSNSCFIKPNKKVLNVDEIFGNVFNQLAQFTFFSRITLIKALRYAMEERDQYDPELIAFVRSLIVDPPTRKTRPNLQTTNMTDYSQLGQSSYIDSILSEKQDGFFVEVGAYDGELFSNSLFFELHRNWTGLLIEPVPFHYRILRKKQRRAYLLNACLAGSKPIIARLEVAGVLSQRRSKRQKQNFEIPTAIKLYVNIPCFSLNTVLRALNIRQVDYFSLDIEGGELEVVQNLDVVNFTFQSLTIEYNGKEDRHKKMLEIIRPLGYTETKSDGQDFYLLKT